MSAYNDFIASLYHVPPMHICNDPVCSFMHLYNKFLVRVLEGMKICENVYNQKILQVYNVQLVTLQLRGKVIFLLIPVCCHHNPTWTTVYAQAGGMQPTGMQSCLVYLYKNLLSSWGQFMAEIFYILVICDLKFNYYIISIYTSGVWAKEINFT